MDYNSLKQILLRRKYTIIVSLLTIIALILRFYHLDYNSLWGDEMATLTFVSGSVADIWNVMYTDVRPSPPLFYILEHFMLYFGSSEFILRLLPAIFGVMAVPIIYLVGKIIINENAGIIAAALLTVSQCHIQLSQDARTYTLTMLLFLVASLFYLHAVKSNKILYWVLFSAFGALAFWSHFYVVFGLIAIYLHLIITKWDSVNHRIVDFKYILLSIVLFGVFISPLLFVLYHVTGGATMSYGFSLFVVPHSYYSLLRWNVTTITILNMTVVVIYSLLTLVGLVSLWKSKVNGYLLLLFCIVIPMILVFIASLLFDFHTAGTHILYVLPYLLLSISGIVVLFKKRLNVNKIAILFVCLILFSSLLYLPAYYTTMTKVDYRSCANELTELTNDGDIIVGASSLFRYYYDAERDNTILINITDMNDLDEIKSSYTNKSIYYVTSLGNNNSKNITAIAPSGSLYLDSFISKLKLSSQESRFNYTDTVNWLDNNTIICISYLYPGIYHPDIYIHKFVKS